MVTSSSSARNLAEEKNLPKPIVQFKSSPNPRSYAGPTREQHPSSWSTPPPPPQSWSTSTQWSAAPAAAMWPGQGAQGAWAQGPPAMTAVPTGWPPLPTHQPWSSPSPPMASTIGKGKGKGNPGSYSGKGVTPGRGNNLGKGGKGEAMLAPVQAPPPSDFIPSDRQGKKCGLCRDAGREWNHDYLSCSFWLEEQDRKLRE